MPSFDDVLLTSVPEADLALIEALLPGARVAHEPLSPELATAHHDAQRLAVMVHDPVTPEALAAFDDLRCVITRSDGHDHLPLAWLDEQGITALHLEGYATDSVAELTIALLIALARRVPEAQATTMGARPSWSREHLIGRRLSELTVGVIGTGRIGTRVVELLAPLGPTVLAHDLIEDARVAAMDHVTYIGRLDDLLPNCDVITLHVPLDPVTRDLLDAKALAQLPRGALVVNTARGALIDQAAIAAALADGRLGGYAADVLPGEPTPPDLARFQGLENVVLLPHLGAHNAATIRARYEETARALTAFAEGCADALAPYEIA